MKFIQNLLGKEGFKPIKEKERYKCPFYGFATEMGMTIDTKGNQCALITNSHSPCRMEINNQTPNWDNCDYLNNEKNIDEIKKIDSVSKKSRAFPDEFCPENVKEWEGIKLIEWINYTLGRKKLVS